VFFEDESECRKTLKTNAFLNTLKPKQEQERERDESGREEAKRKHKGREKVRDTISGGRKSIILLEGSQPLLARPSNKSKIRMKKFGR
jgi:hypothetical protein